MSSICQQKPRQQHDELVVIRHTHNQNMKKGDGYKKTIKKCAKKINEKIIYLEGKWTCKQANTHLLLRQPLLLFVSGNRCWRRLSVAKIRVFSTLFCASLYINLLINNPSRSIVFVSLSLYLLVFLGRYFYCGLVKDESRLSFLIKTKVFIKTKGIFVSSAFCQHQ